jgi:hypothetical protein
VRWDHPLTSREPPVVKWIGLFAQAGVLATLAAPAAIYMGEAWAGVLIGLSIAAYTRGRATIGFVFGITAIWGLVAWPMWSLVCGFGVQYLVDTVKLCIWQLRPPIGMPEAQGTR